MKPACQVERNNYVVMERQRLLWVRIPKTGTTSIRNAWHDKPPRSQPYRLAKKRNDEGYYTIVFTRHPFERLISAAHMGGKFSPKRGKPLNPVQILDKWVMPFIGTPWKMDKHFRPQWTFIDGLRIDFWGRLETLQEDWERLLEIKPIKANRDLMRLMSKDHPPWHELEYDWKRLYPVYKQDFELGYETPAFR